MMLSAGRFGVVGRILAIDWGTVRLGLAVSDELLVTAQPLPARRRQGMRGDLDYLKGLRDHWGIERVIVGLPKGLSGTLGPSATEAKAFADRVRVALEVPVLLWDERLTTQEAERVLIAAGVRRRRRREVVDSAAATLLLQGYLDREARRRAGGAGSAGTRS
ncbi:MAG: Holliday junction resolvase RuvX [Candidatus Methylomirabilales bacterium]